MTSLRLARQREELQQNNLAQTGDRMRTVIEMLRRAMDRVPSTGHASRGLRRIRPRGVVARRNLSGLLRLGLVTVAFALGSASASSAADNEIRIGNTIPYSGPAAAYGIIGKTIAAYFNRINEQGGINGRKINFISYDDGYNPQKTVELTRKLVEADEVLLIFNSLGTPGNTAIQKYMNTKKVPQIFVPSGAAKWNDPKNFPWTIGWQPNY